MKYFSTYYYNQIDRIIRILVPRRSSVYNSKSGKKLTGVYDYIILLDSLADIPDIHTYLTELKKHSNSKTKIVVIYYNFLWKPILDLASFLGFRRKIQHEQNWLSCDDIKNIFYLTGYDEVIRQKRILLPADLGIFSKIINNLFDQLPLVNFFCLATFQIFRLNPIPKDYSVSIIIPARNEQDNVKGVLKKIPRFGTRQEIIFVEGNSHDDTFCTIQEEITQNPGIKALLYKQKGKGKGDAVRLGFSKASNEILMILDADLTVNPSELPKFYDVLAKGLGDFVNGSRLIYPMEKRAMQTLNYMANRFFSMVFTYLLGQRVKDTLCGTKVLFKLDYLEIEKNRKYFGDFDPFGDFDLLFGAAKLNLKIVEVPIRYRERIYGSTNISRFIHGILLFRMTFFAAKKIKFV